MYAVCACGIASPAYLLYAVEKDHGSELSSPHPYHASGSGREIGKIKVQALKIELTRILRGKLRKSEIRGKSKSQL